MLQVVQNYKSGRLRLEEVPAPALKKGGLLVRTHYSLVSSGTEANAIRQASMNILAQAKARPDHVKKVLQSVKNQGLKATYDTVINRLDSLTPLGYSSSGTIVDIACDAEEFHLGQRVACAGVNYANHAQYNYIPSNLAVPVPDNVPLDEAACTTVGTVALQGFRQSELSLGDTVVVIGLGLIGQIYLQIAHAAGCRTIGIDINKQRIQLALDLGADAACGFDRLTATSAVENITHGIGADAVVLALGADSNEPLELAVHLLRDRGKIVNIGKAKIDVPYEPFFKKDLKLVFSRSYGPGRYDPNYEKKGIDYPVGYVKWTERRNMSAFLDLLAQKKINLKPIIENPVPFENAEQAYQGLRDGCAGLGILFEYGDTDQPNQEIAHTIPLKTSSALRPIVLGCIGAGNYANTKLLPTLARDKNISLKTVATTRGTSSKTAALRFGFAQATTDYSQIITDDQINTVLVATAHNSHAQLIAESLRAGKAVFAEKPLAITPEQLDTIKTAIEQSGNDRLQIGFNRRFAPLSQLIHNVFAQINTPRQIIMRINAGRIEPGGWMSDAQLSGGRFIGEGCHFVDLASFFVGQLSANPDDLSVQLRYPDGSLATIVYTTSGSSGLSKEYIEIHAGGKSAILDDFKRAFIYAGKKKKHTCRSQDKGQKAQLAAFCRAILTGSEMPIPLPSLFATTCATFKAGESLKSKQPETISF